MNRITPEEVIAAYRESGLKPIRLDMYDRGTCACAIGVILYKETYGHHGPAWDLAHERYGNSYMWGFIRGYDGGRIEKTLDRDAEMEGDDFDESVYKSAFKDGQRAWQAVVDAGLV